MVLNLVGILEDPTGKKGSTMRKIAIIGAGSAQFSGGIIRDLCVTPSLHGTKLTLMDVDARRLKFITEMGCKMTAELNASLEFEATTDRIEALRNADFVINTAQDQGHGWVNAEADMMARHGYYRNGTLGQIYQAAFLLEVAKDIQKYCPNAVLIQSSNPVFEGCTVIHRGTDVQAIGLCHGHYGYREIADVLGLERSHVTAKMFGFNHWIWMTDFRYKGQNAYPLIDQWIAENAESYWKQPRKYADQQMSRAAITLYQMMGLMPIGDTPRMMDHPSLLGWLFNESLEAKKYWYSQQGGFDSAEGWAEYLRDLGKNLQDIEEAATLSEKRVTDIFKPVQSDEQIVPIIESLLFNKPNIYQVNVPNRGHVVEGFPEDIVVECEALVSSAGVQPLHMGRLPTRVMAGAMNPRYAECELMSEFVLTGEREALRLLLLHDHATQSLAQVDALIDEWILDPRNRCIRDIMKQGGKQYG